jgi:hypothetical protein
MSIRVPDGVIVRMASIFEAPNPGRWKWEQGISVSAFCGLRCGSQCADVANEFTNDGLEIKQLVVEDCTCFSELRRIASAATSALSHPCNKENEDDNAENVFRRHAVFLLNINNTCQLSILPSLHVRLFIYFAIAERPARSQHT